MPPSSMLGSCQEYPTKHRNDMVFFAHDECPDRSRFARCLWRHFSGTDLRSVCPRRSTVRFPLNRGPQLFIHISHTMGVDILLAQPVRGASTRAQITPLVRERASRNPLV